MIYTLIEEIQIIILLIIYGLYISLYYDIVNILIYRIRNKIIKIIIEVILWSVQIYVTYLFTYQIQDGYIPIYFLLFVFIGVTIYLLFYKKIRLVLNVISLKISKCIQMLLREITNFAYPKYMKLINKTFKSRRRGKKNIDIETSKW